MGRLIKNTVFKSGSYAIGLDTTSAGFRPNVQLLTGQSAVRYNTTSDKLEYYSQGLASWQTIGNVGTGTAHVTKDSFSGITGHTEFGPMSFAYNPGFEANVLVHVGGVYQIPGTNYNFYGNTTIHFGSAPSNGSDITIIHGLNSTIAS